MGDAPLMLGVSGCRGIVGESLTPDVISRYAGAFGGWLRERHGGKPVTVVLGRDGRAGGHVVRHAAIAGLCGSGCDVVDLGIETTPTIGVMVDALEADAGMVLTASHNPQQWNGMKCLLREADECERGGVSACAPSAQMAAEIVDRFKSGKNDWQRWDRLGAVTRQRDAAAVHVARVVERFGEDVLTAIAAMKPTVVLDSVNGAGAHAGRQLLERMGCRVVQLGAEDTGIFPHTPEPTRENLAGAGGLCEAVREHGAIVGFAQDPDADRLAVIDERGAYIGEEYTLVLAASQVIEMGMRGAERRSEKVAVNLSTSRMIEDVAGEFGAEVVRTPVGEAHVVQAMKHADMVIGGEGNGGVIWSSVTYVRDSLGAMALVLAAIVRANRQVSELVGRVPAYAIEKRKVTIASKAEAGPAEEKLVAWASGGGGGTDARIDTQDGVRVDWADREPESGGSGGGPAWVHVRASNTEPILRLIGEARTPEGVSSLLDTVAAVVG
ncbi:MAG: phosphoglucosamine mutase [Planctomycetota bacterium]|nr:phosphoglucosamine mutase [Planctomycetota bacterium]